MDGSRFGVRAGSGGDLTAPPRVSWWDGDDGKWKCREVVTATKRESRGPTKPAPTNSILAAPLIVGREHKRNKQKETAGRRRSSLGSERGSCYN